jgi:MoaA/NifB/PqqE/SkfB family radical SAM enzyme
MPFCYSPWTNIDISPTGDITPCCKFQKNYYDQKFNIQHNSMQEYANSEFITGIKQQFQQDKWPSGCERCRIEEENQIESKRVLDYTRWKNHYDNYDLASNEFITSSLAFGNTCNLKCITCSPYSSSRWQKEYVDLYQIDIPHYKFYKNNFVKDFVANAPNIVHIDIPGGEPFLSGITEQKELLTHYVQSGQANTISLHYTTNAMIFPDTEWWKLWQHFKEVELQLSIDGIEKRYEYIRFPAEWNTLVDNVARYIAKEKELANVKLGVSYTVSAYNIYYIDEFFSWCYNVGLPKPWLGRVHNPVYMRPSVWPQEVKTVIIDQLNNSMHEDTKYWSKLMLNTDDSEFFNEFKLRLYKHDNYRKTSFSSTFPELAKYI